ncbi:MULTISPECIES: hypothetical protein [unclassified Pseudomonas]|uniref:hypothetical protein n=1 Tax=unclassified Pseudomonas TaxID=196821 RepID=UPI0025FE8EC4|nr:MULTISPECIES: hypothetical protein [unclassified Pseudomonas]
MTLHTHILQLKERLFEHAVRLDESLLDLLLADDFVEFGRSLEDSGTALIAAKTRPMLGLDLYTLCHLLPIC